MNVETEYLLGYLRPKDWADAIREARDSDMSEKKMWAILKELDKRYGAILEAVEEELEVTS